MEAEAEATVKYEGYNGQIDLNDDELVITREGLAARIIFGKNTPGRRIPLQALSGVRLKEATGTPSEGRGGRPPSRHRRGERPVEQPSD